MAPKSSVSHAVCASLLTLLFASLVALAADAETGNTPQPTPQWPVTLPDAKAAETPAPATWSPEEIAAAKNRCAALLRGLHAVAVAKDPIREGECGTPAPMQLISIGRNPQVTFSPPPTVTCEMIQALDSWFKSDVQKAAREMLDGPIVRVALMSDYSCRNAYGRKQSRLSEHGRANAIDVAAFATERGTRATVLTDWGMTERDIKARIAAAEKAQRAMDARKALVARNAAKSAPHARPASPSPMIAAADLPKSSRRPAQTVEDLVLKGSIPDGLAFNRSGPSNHGFGATGSAGAAGIGLMPSNHLGGPKADSDDTTVTAGSDDVQARQRFLRHIHDSACRTFGTSLGPEANEFHRNHFHLDMAHRQSLRICE
jgi:hypothetical protein